MNSNHTAENGCRAKEVIQLIKKHLVNSIKALQKHYVTSDALVTSDDGDANTLCCALEAVFVHGLKAKHIKAETGAKGRKLWGRVPLPQPAFWTLLKSITHRNIISELEHLDFINTDVGRCRAWLRLALNDGLMECYLKLLVHEKAHLSEYYRSPALLLDTEEVEFLLSYLQGLSSLAFDLSYKSAVLNEWTITPLSLSGLCPALELLDPSMGLEPRRKESLESLSQSSGSDEVETHPALLPLGRSRPASRLATSNLSISTASSSQLSSSLGSDGLLPGMSVCTQSPDRGEEPTSDDSGLDTAMAKDLDQSLQEVLAEFSRAQRRSESVGITKQGHAVVEPSPPQHPCPAAPFCTARISCLTTVEHSDDAKPTPATAEPQLPSTANPPKAEEMAGAKIQDASMPIVTEEVANDSSTHHIIKEEAKDRTSHIHGQEGGQILSPVSPGICPKTSWITEDDFSLPSPPPFVEMGKSLLTPCSPSSEKAAVDQPSIPSGAIEQGGPPASSSEAGKPMLSPERESKGFRVIHRRQIGLSNPFRGLLKLGTLERRGGMGIWKEFFCELSPLELRLYVDSEERVCVESCSLLRCESVGQVHSDGRFDLVFSGRRLCLRAASQDEAEDWLERLHEALKKCRPQQEEDWETLGWPEVMEDFEGNSASGSPGNTSALLQYSGTGPNGLDWSCTLAPELDAVKESVLYLETERTWSPFIFSLSLEALKCFKARNREKTLSNSYGVETIQDILPDVSLGGPAFFKIITSKAVLKLQAENAEEAADWRDLVRRVLMSYLETAEEALTLGGNLDGNSQVALKNTVKENGFLLQYLVAIPMEKGLDCQSFICAGCSRQIGFSFPKPKLCSFTGQYYCETCHQDDESVIPSRLIHNWDLALHPGALSSNHVS
ncbi:pleckstrin homology domain-containing family M member 1 isoform X2 [Pogona vitticeps]